MGFNTIPVESLKSPTDPNIPFFAWKEVIGTTPITIDILNKFGCLAKAVIIENDDSTNNISVVTIDPANPVETIPPNTKGEDDSWTSFIQVTPNAVSGSGVLELQLVKLSDAYKTPKIDKATYDRMVML